MSLGWPPGRLHSEWQQHSEWQWRTWQWAGLQVGCATGNVHPSPPSGILRSPGHITNVAAYVVRHNARPRLSPSAPHGPERLEFGVPGSPPGHVLALALGAVVLIRCKRGGAAVASLPDPPVARRRPPEHRAPRSICALSPARLEHELPRGALPGLRAPRQPRARCTGGMHIRLHRGRQHARPCRAAFARADAFADAHAFEHPALRAVGKGHRMVVGDLRPG